MKRSYSESVEGAYMAQKERLNLIQERLQKENRVTVSRLSKEFGVTEETIRRDLEKLEKEGVLTRVHGGAVFNSERAAENIHYLIRAQHNHREKQTIGELAASILPGQVTICADASSTVMEAVQLLRNRPETTVLTNSVQIVRELSQSAMTVVSTGGIINKTTFSMQGNFVRKVLSEYFVDIVLISCKALSLDGGIFDSNAEEGELKHQMVLQGQKVILLVDHSKFNRKAFVKVMELDELDTLVTDREPSEEWKRLCSKKGITLLYPGSEN